MAAKPNSTCPAAFFITDEISERRLLVETGAMQSIFPPSRERLEKNTRLTTLPHSSKRNSCPHLWHDLGDLNPGAQIPLAFRLLGTDFLGHHGLLVDISRQRLLDTRMCQSRQLSTGPGMPSICSTAPNNYTSLLQEFQMCPNQNYSSHLGLQQSMASSTTPRRAHQPMPSSGICPPEVTRHQTGLRRSGTRGRL